MQQTLLGTVRDFEESSSRYRNPELGSPMTSEQTSLVCSGPKGFNKMKTRLTQKQPGRWVPNGTHTHMQEMQYERLLKLFILVFFYASSKPSLSEHKVGTIASVAKPGSIPINIQYLLDIFAWCSTARCNCTVLTRKYYQILFLFGSGALSLDGPMASSHTASSKHIKQPYWVPV